MGDSPLAASKYQETVADAIHMPISILLSFELLARVCSLADPHPSLCRW